MATGNFYNKNATHIFVGILENEFDYDDLKDNLIYAFKGDDRFSRVIEMDKWADNDSKIFLSVVSKGKQYKDFDVKISMDIIIRSGYYEHCNIDWNMFFQISGDEFEIDEDIENALWGYVEEGMVKRYASWVEKWIDKNKEEFKGMVEKIIADYTTPYTVSARFSNGETWYKKVGEESEEKVVE